MKTIQESSRVSFTVFLTLLISYSANGQYSIKGKVVSGDDKQGLSFANVFLSNTSRGTQTDLNGHFELPHLPEGTFKMSVSFVGYESIVIEVHPQEQKTYTIILKPSMKSLNAVVVRGKSFRPSERANNLKIFRENFIGLSENARWCVIENPDVLEFKKEALLFEATSDSLLIIENSGLGYRLKFVLEQFTLNLLTKKLLYKGQVVYERLLPKNTRQEKRWATNRLKAYHGSELHFMRALYKHQLSEEGFFFNVYKDQTKKDGTIANVTVPDTFLVVKSKVFNRRISLPTIYKYNRILDSLASLNASQPVLSFDGQLEVVYAHESEPYEYRKRRDPASLKNTLMQKSRLYLLKPGVKVEANGMILSEENLPTVGYWSWELVSESLPVDYDPEEDRQILTKRSKK